MQSSKKITLVVMCGVLLLLCVFFLSRLSLSDSEETLQSSNDTAIQGSREVEQEAQESTTKSTTTSELRQPRTEVSDESFTDVHAAFLQAAFIYDSLDTQKEQMEPFAYSEDRYPALGITEGVPVYQDLACKIIEETSFFRQIDEQNQEVLTRIHVLYDSDHNHDHETGEHAHKETNQVLLVTIHYRRSGETWLVYDLTYEEDPSNSQFYSN